MNVDRAELSGTGAALAVPRRADRGAVDRASPGQQCARAAGDGGRTGRGCRACSQQRPPPPRQPAQAPEIGEAPVIEPSPAPPLEAVGPCRRPCPAPSKPAAQADTRAAAGNPPRCAPPRPPRVAAHRRRFPQGLRRDSRRAAKPGPAAAKFAPRPRPASPTRSPARSSRCADGQRDLGEGADQNPVTP